MTTAARRRRAERGPSWALRWSTASECGVRLLCFPHAGGGASAYSAWPKLLPRSIDVHAVQLPGREGRVQEGYCRDLEIALDAIVKEIGELAPIPLVLFGHSMGALMAFEAAHRLAAQGSRAPILLAVSGFPGPATWQPSDVEAAGSLDVTDILASFGGIPDEVRSHPALWARAQEAFVADARMLASYRYRERAPLEIPIVTFSGADDVIGATAMASWSIETAQAVRHFSFEGGHFFLHQQRDAFLGELERELRFALLHDELCQGDRS